MSIPFDVWSSDGVGSGLTIGRVITSTSQRYMAVVVVVRLQHTFLHYTHNFAAACIAACPLSGSVRTSAMGPDFAVIL
jgi:hypothetical protein